MGNDILRAAQQPFHDCAKYVCNAADSECSSDCCGSPCSCKFATHETGDESPDVVEKAITPEREYAIHGV